MAALRVVGKLLISLGVGVLLFVAWVLWGTGLYTAREQDRLREEFSESQQFPAEREEGDKASSSPYRGPGDDFQPAPGEAVFLLDIPEIDLRNVVVEGVGEEELKLGPGHFPECRERFPPPLCLGEAVWPGERGRVIVSGHRTTYGQPFWSLDKLKPEDEILINTRGWGRFTYVVTKTEVVLPTDRTIANSHPPGDKAELVLTTCNPRFSAAERLVVFAEMDTSA